MTPLVAATDLLHHLTASTHAEGITEIAVAATITNIDGHILLIAEPGRDFIDDTWALPTRRVLPGESLTDALARTLAGTGLSIHEVTGYLGHHDREDTDTEITRVFSFAVTAADPSSICRSGRIRHWWAEADDLNELGSLPSPQQRPPAAQQAPSQPETEEPLAAALRRGARGLYPEEAGTELLINHSSWLYRDDFHRRYVHAGTGIAGVDWPAAITALNTGELPNSATEARILRLAASLAGGIPVNLRDALTGLDTRQHPPGQSGSPPRQRPKTSGTPLRQQDS